MKNALAMALAAPVVIFVFLYALVVQPERSAALEAQYQLAIARGELNRRRATVKLGEEARGSARKAVEAMTSALNDPSVGGVSNAAVSQGRSNSAATPVTVTFDARYEQIGRFLWNLRALPATFDLRSVEIAPQAESRAGLLHAKMTFLMLDPGARATRASVPAAISAGIPPEWNRDPFARDVRTVTARKPVALPAVQQGPDPVVSSILFSDGRRIARVDGRIVGPGDRLGLGVVQFIEPEAVVIVEPGGRTRRLQIARPLIGTLPR